MKWNPEAPPRTFSLEADGLEALRKTQTLRVPEVVLVSDDPPFLAMEYLPDTPTQAPTDFAHKIGAGLAALHLASPDTPRFGYPTDNYIGNFVQHNHTRTERWSDFYRDSRLLPQIVLAQQRHLLPPHRERLLHTVIERLDTLLSDFPSDISLLHGDLWRGNLLCLPEDIPALIDPAVYYGPREMEIAFMELFGGFPPGFLAAYTVHYPLDSGYPRRRALHQIFPLLNHLNHFGESYGPRLDATLSEALATSRTPTYQQ